jgi:pyruvate dehydrogenase E2 component (dihydrolipoamide acetyltransferase)
MSERIHPISMPKWGMTMTEGKVAGWLVGEGDAVEPGHDVVEIETEKITNVMDTPASGVVRRVVVPAGATAPVGTLLAVVAPPEVPDSDVEAFIGRYASDVSAAAAGEAPAARAVDAPPHAINVLTLGSGEATPLILLHGFAGDLNNWLFNQPDLAQDRTVHALDLPGHGNSSLTEGSGSVPDLAKAVTAAMDALGVPTAHLVGHSLGGSVALFLALRQPQRVASATLVCPGGLGPEIDMVFIDGVLAAERRKAMQDVLGRLFADPAAATRQMADRLLEQKRRDGVPEAWARVAEANFHGGHQAGGMRDALGFLMTPLLVIWGDKDRIIPAAHAEDLPDRVRVEIIEGAGHMPHMEAAAAFNATVRGFLKQVESA